MAIYSLIGRFLYDAYRRANTIYGITEDSALILTKTFWQSRLNRVCLWFAQEQLDAPGELARHERRRPILRIRAEHRRGLSALHSSTAWKGFCTAREVSW